MFRPVKLIRLLAVAALLAAPACERHPKWTTASGIEIAELAEGEGALPNPGDLLAVHYTIWNLDGKQIDQSPNPTPFRFRLGWDDVLAGFDETVRTMRVGAKRIAVIPPELAYGVEGLPPVVPPNMTIKLEVALVEITPTPECPEPWDESGHELVTLVSGLQYVDFKIGEGPEITPAHTVAVHYVGWLEDGTCFETTYWTGRPYEFEIKSAPLIEGWVQGLLTMRAGGERKLIIPPFLAYGEKGQGRKIPPNSTLIFDMEVLDAWIAGVTVDSLSN